MTRVAVTILYAEKQWTQALCSKDSDGDGKTNGEELGDPKCVWKPGDIPEFVDNLSNPGVCDPHDSAQCQAFNNWKICQEADFECPPLDEEGVIEQTFRMTRNKVPVKETTFVCQYFELPSDKDYHLIATKPYIDNAHIMHHIVLYGCPNEVSEEMKVEYSEPTECKMVTSYCNKPLDIWSLGMLGTCLDAPAAFRFGKSTFSSFVFEFHRTNPALRDDYWDSSGMTLFYTPNLRPYDAGMFITGQLHLLLPPKQNKVTVESTCKSKCTKEIINGTIKLISGWHHMHLLGTQGFVDLYQEGKKKSLIDEPYFSYDSPETFLYKPHIEVNPGDEIKTTCVYNTMTRQKNTYWGDDTFSEMCFSFLTYYPSLEEGFAGCVTFGEADCMSYKESDCDYSKLNETKEEFIDGLYDYCDPTGQTCAKCCLLYLTSTLKGDPCWRGILRETTQFLITDEWNDRNVTNMLLKCEQLYDLDELLFEPTKKKKEGKSIKRYTSNTSKTSGSMILILSNIACWFVLRPTLGAIY